MIAPLRVGARGDTALLVLRVVIGVAFVLHGLPKIEHPATWLASSLPSAPRWLGAVVAFAEFGGGIALVLGAFTQLFAFLIACDMLVAIFFVLVPRGAVFVTTGGKAPSYEIAALYLAAAVAFILMGAGAYSIDGAFGKSGGASTPSRRTRRR